MTTSTSTTRTKGDILLRRQFKTGPAHGSLAGFYELTRPIYSSLNEVEKHYRIATETKVWFIEWRQLIGVRDRGIPHPLRQGDAVYQPREFAGIGFFTLSLIAIDFRRVIDNALDQTPIAPETIERANRWISVLAPRPALTLQGDRVQLSAKSAAADELCVDTEGQSETPVVDPEVLLFERAALGGLINQFLNGLEDTRRLGRCPEDGTVFLRTNAKQKYCSERCEARAGKRRENARKIGKSKPE